MFCDCDRYMDGCVLWQQFNCRYVCFLFVCNLIDLYLNTGRMILIGWINIEYKYVQAPVYLVERKLTAIKESLERHEIQPDFPGLMYYRS